MYNAQQMVQILANAPTRVLEAFSALSGTKAGKIAETILQVRYDTFAHEQNV